METTSLLVDGHGDNRSGSGVGYPFALGTEHGYFVAGVQTLEDELLLLLPAPRAVMKPAVAVRVGE